jgi:type IV pilus assembly protein PilY1
MNAARNTAFVAASDGLLHAIDVATGAERWGYAPQAALAEMGLSTQLNWGFKAMHDGSPVIGRVGASEMLFGSLGAGGAGWYGLDITQAETTLPAATRATTVMWELPGTDATLQAQMGLAVGRPALVRTSAFGDVVLLSSGYNAALRDGRGRLFVVRPTDGQVLATLATDIVAPGIDPGFAQFTPFREVDGTVRYVFGGDEHGNLWRFDLLASSVSRLARLTDAAGNAQALTARPALVEYRGQRIVMVGTGRLLALSDLAPETRGNSFYAIADGAELTAPRTTLVRQPLTANADGTRTIDPAQVLPVDFTTQRGWFIDLPADERAHITPLVGITAVAFVTNQPRSDPCTTASYRYALDIARGAALDDPAQTGGLIGSALTTGQGAAGNSVIVTASSPVGGSTPGAVEHCIRHADGTLECVELEKDTGARPSKSGWRRIVR